MQILTIIAFSGVIALFVALLITFVVLDERVTRLEITIDEIKRELDKDD